VVLFVTVKEEPVRADVVCPVVMIRAAYKRFCSAEADVNCSVIAARSNSTSKLQLASTKLPAYGL